MRSAATDQARVRDAFRRQRAGLAPAAYVVVARTAAARADNAALRAAFAALLQRAAALPSRPRPAIMPAASLPSPPRAVLQDGRTSLPDDPDPHVPAPLPG